MYKVEFYRKALKEYQEIWEYIWQDNLFYANKVLKNIDDTIDTIKIFPSIWKSISKTHRLIVESEYKYKIVYRILWDIIYIVSISKYKKDWY